MTSTSRLRTPLIAFIALVAVAAAFPACSKSPAPSSAPEEAPGPGLAARYDLLPVLRPGFTTGMMSSYDRSGGNDDGFSGRYSFLREEPDGLVIAELEGPGMVTRFHLPSPTDEFVEFYFDGEAQPRIRRLIPEMFDGAHPPFLAPLVGAGSGGRYSYVPLPFRKSVKILVRTKRFRFYDINYVRFPVGTEIETYTDPPSGSYARDLERLRAAFGARPGSDISKSLVPEGAPLETRAISASLPPGGRVTLFETSRPGRLAGLRLSPAAGFAGPGRDIVLRMTWDGDAAPAVEAPVVDLFGGSFGDPSARSLFAGTTAEGVDYLYLPMPYERSARVELVSERTGGPAVDVRAETVFAPVGKSAGEGRLYARWRRENPTTPGRPPGGGGGTGSA